MTFRPMLSATIKDVMKEVRFPVLASPKYDGIRAVVIGRHLYSRHMKLIPNVHLQERYGIPMFEGYDGELICGDPTDPQCFTYTTSVVMSRGVDPGNVSFYVFDRIAPPNLPFLERRKYTRVDIHQRRKVIRVPQTLIHSFNELVVYEERVTSKGYEGVILRDPTGRYKEGRSTISEQGMMKLKRFLDSEAKVIGIEPRYHNANPATINELGFTHRTSHKANKQALETMGALTVQWQGMTFGIGTGFDDGLRREIWMNKRRYLGLMVKFKYLPSVKEAPRHPVFIGFRKD